MHRSKQGYIVEGCRIPDTSRNTQLRYELTALLYGTTPSPLLPDNATVLCPVMALKAYRTVTVDQEFVIERETLFLLLNHTSSLAYQLSKLFFDAMYFCYSLLTGTGEILSNVHQCISVSLANLCRTPLEQIVLAGRW